jgi:hypothetical protein
MAANKSPTRQTKIKQISKRTKNLLHNLKNEGIQNYLKGLTPIEATDYSLWKATRKIKQLQHQIPPIRINHNTWVRTDKQQSTAFAEHLASVFQPFPSQLSAVEEETINNELNTHTSWPCQRRKSELTRLKMLYNMKSIQK